MKNKHELTEKLKVLETEIHELRLDLKTTSRKLKSSQDYETDLIQRQVKAREKTELYQKDFFIKSNEILEVHKKMKELMEVYTGHFYTQIEL